MKRFFFNWRPPIEIDKLKLSFALLMLVTAISNFANAQEALKEKSPNKITPVVAFQLGTSGLGLELSAATSRHWSFALGFTHLEAGAEFTADALGLRVLNKPYIQSNILSGQARYSFRENGRFNLVAGVSWMDWEMQYVFANANDLKLGNVIFPRNEVGSAEIKSSNTWSVTPYLGLHLGRANPKTRLSMAMDFGTFFTNGQSLSANGTGLSSSIKLEEQKLQENFSTYKLLLNLNFLIRCKI